MVDDLCGFCFITSTDLLKEIGGFDEQFRHGSWEDVDLIKRINKTYGPRIVVNMEVFVSHRGIKEKASSFTQEPLKSAYYFVLNSFRYANTWGYKELIKRLTFGLKSQTGKGTISEHLPKKILL